MVNMLYLCGPQMGLINVTKRTGLPWFKLQSKTILFTWEDEHYLFQFLFSPERRLKLGYCCFRVCDRPLLHQDNVYVHLLLVVVNILYLWIIPISRYLWTWIHGLSQRRRVCMKLWSTQWRYNQGRAERPEVVSVRAAQYEGQCDREITFIRGCYRKWDKA